LRKRPSCSGHREGVCYSTNGFRAVMRSNPEQAYVRPRKKADHSRT
jgi:hypothetical protein